MPHADADMADVRPAAPMALTETAFAKVNLALHVRGKRPDGYHELESLFVFADEGDQLLGVLGSDDHISLGLRGPFGHLLHVGPDNLVVKAARALQSHIGEQRGAALVLTKNLPVASGIGGGSADAAAALRLLLRLWDVPLPAERLHEVALSLGSDVPACLTSVTQLVSGRGELLRRHAMPELDGRPMLLVNPGIALSTARIFAGWDRLDRGPLRADDLAQLAGEGRNDLQRSAIAEAPVVAQVLDMLARCQGTRLVRMSGSGATCFALFDDDEACGQAARAVQAAHPQWWVAETRIRAA